MKTIIIALFLSFSVLGITTKEFVYEVDGITHKGFIAAPEGEQKGPGVIVVHEWWGQNEYPKMRARQLAEKGYVAFAVDMFGEGKIAKHPDKAKEFASKAMSDMKELRQKFEKGLEILKKHPNVDDKKIAAIGFCFGGTVVLQMAKMGVDLDLVASFHGGLPENYNIPKRADNPKILIFNGEADPMISAEQVKAMKSSLEKAEVNYVFENYKGAKHAFTNPLADKFGKEFNMPLAYDEKAASDSWDKLLSALKAL
ncbi:MAG: dienelactone hydrolase family protein [Bacteriovoracaceae bacterium]|nr:dienelactone hydrolase family protein [Bacteriovoracaceae bacterium]